MTFTFRQAAIADIPAIGKVISASVRALQPEYTKAERETALKTVFTVDSRLVADGTYIVAHADDGGMVGCGGWSKRRTLYGGDDQVEAAKPELLDPATDAAKIRAIFVHPAFARQGLGSRILRMAEEAAAEAGFRLLEMGSTLAGLALYERKGYREVERIKVPLRDGESIEVVRMVKMLAG